MIEKKASIHWEGAGKTGQGQVSTETGALKNHPYGVAARFADGKGTNPEEILGAAHAACFTMFFAVSCEKAGIAVGSIDTTATVRLAKEGEGFKIDRIALTMEATVPGLDQAKFKRKFAMKISATPEVVPHQSARTEHRERAPNRICRQVPVSCKLIEP